MVTPSHPGREGVARGDDSLGELAERPHGTVPPMLGDGGFLLGIGPREPGVVEAALGRMSEKTERVSAGSEASVRGPISSTRNRESSAASRPARVFAVAMYDTPERSTAHSR